MMRSLILTAVLAAASLGVVAVTPDKADARPPWRAGWYGSYYNGPYYNWGGGYWNGATYYDGTSAWHPRYYGAPATYEPYYYGSYYYAPPSNYYYGSYYGPGWIAPRTMRSYYWP
jgi:hypothetical protein